METKNQEISLQDIKKSSVENSNTDTFKRVSIKDIVPERENPNSRSANQQKLGNEIDNALNRVKKTYIKEVVEEQEKINEAAIEAEIEGQDLDDDFSRELNDIIGDVKPIETDENGHLIKDPYEIDDFEIALDKPNKKVVVPVDEVVNVESTFIEEKEYDPETSIGMGDNIDENDFAELGLDDEDEEEKNDTTSEEKEFKNFTSKLAGKLNPIKNPLDLNSITVIKKPLAISNALLDYSKNIHVSDWVMYADRKAFSIESFTATQIDELDSRNYNQRNRYNTFMDIYGKIYNHIVGLKEKMKLEEWLKTLNFFSLNDIWFGVYKASFEKSNIVPYSCPHCNKTFVREPNIIDMVKFSTKEDEANFKKIFDEGEVIEKPEYPVLRVQISDKFVVDLREPSVWNVIFENAILDDTFRQKYAKLLTTITYIDAMYIVRTTGEETFLQEIQPKDYPGNMLKSIKHRVYTYAKLLQTLTSDERSIIKSYINDIVNSHNEVTYVIPETTCEHCKKKIEEVEQTGEQLLFTRQDLADIANFSQK